MTDHSDNSEAFSELYRLVIASLTGEITPDQVARLDELVCNDPQARRLYTQLIYESVNLCTWAESDQEEVADEAAIPSTVARPRRRSTAKRWAWVGAAASLLACLLAGWIFVSSTGQQPPVASNQELERETMAVAEEAQSVLDLLGELERENETIVRILGQDSGAEPESDNEEEEPA
jgi:hypothetical protein